MRWNLKPEPKVGEWRTRIRFAWWPVTLSRGERVWLERYVSVERLEEDVDFYLNDWDFLDFRFVRRWVVRWRAPASTCGDAAIHAAMDQPGLPPAALRDRRPPPSSPTTRKPPPAGSPPVPPQRPIRDGKERTGGVKERPTTPRPPPPKPQPRLRREP